MHHWCCCSPRTHKVPTAAASCNNAQSTNGARGNSVKKQLKMAAAGSGAKQRATVPIAAIAPCKRPWWWHPPPAPAPAPHPPHTSRQCGGDGGNGPADVRTRARAWRHSGRRAHRPARSWAAVDALPAGGSVLTYSGGEGASEHSAGCERRSARSAAVLAGTPCGGNMLWRGRTKVILDSIDRSTKPQSANKPRVGNDAERSREQ